jgi:YggT family protein
MYLLARGIDIAIQIIVLLIIIQAVLSFFPRIDRGHPLVSALNQVVNPILRPFQRLLPSMGGLDFSPVLAILTLQVLGNLVTGLLMNLGH